MLIATTSNISVFLLYFQVHISDTLNLFYKLSLDHGFLSFHLSMVQLRKGQNSALYTSEWDENNTMHTLDMLNRYI